MTLQTAPSIEVLYLNTLDALEAVGHWGVPTCAFNHEPFFGQDRLDVLLWRLQRHGLAKR